MNLLYFTSDMILVSGVAAGEDKAQRQQRDAAYVTFLLAQEIWLMQSFLYICMYAQVALTLPLMF